MIPNNIIVLSRRCIMTVRPHTPLIKFRKGGIEGSKTSGSSSSSGVGRSSGPRPILEDYQLPLRYRRRPLDEAEINAINSGGIY
ncbi:uncharacterized protein LOC135849091 [Planococcus citri]|uniref:uncharacterized protein LOC135849091 n=1 Tax=Planococcus citri TaxID=170843 RepID=UPI0031F938C8